MQNTLKNISYSLIFNFGQKYHVNLWFFYCKFSYQYNQSFLSLFSIIHSEEDFNLHFIFKNFYAKISNKYFLPSNFGQKSR